MMFLVALVALLASASAFAPAGDIFTRVLDLHHRNHLMLTFSTNENRARDI
jgi:hypothetical protein